MVFGQRLVDGAGRPLRPSLAYVWRARVYTIQAMTAQGAAAGALLGDAQDGPDGVGGIRQVLGELEARAFVVSPEGTRLTVNMKGDGNGGCVGRERSDAQVKADEEWNRDMGGEGAEAGDGGDSVGLTNNPEGLLNGEERVDNGGGKQWLAQGGLVSAGRSGKEGECTIVPSGEGGLREVGTIVHSSEDGGGSAWKEGLRAEEGVAHRYGFDVEYLRDRFEAEKHLLGMTMTEIAQATGISRSVLSRFRQGGTPSMAVFVAVCSVFRLEPGDFFTK